MSDPEWYKTKELLKVLNEISETLKLIEQNIRKPDMKIPSCKPVRFDRSLTKHGRN